VAAGMALRAASNHPYWPPPVPPLISEKGVVGAFQRIRWPDGHRCAIERQRSEPVILASNHQWAGTHRTAASGLIRLPQMPARFGRQSTPDHHRGLLCF
jgi:hypothetical protein